MFAGMHQPFAILALSKLAQSPLIKQIAKAIALMLCNIFMYGSEFVAQRQKQKEEKKT